MTSDLVILRYNKRTSDRRKKQIIGTSSKCETSVHQRTLSRKWKKTKRENIFKSSDMELKYLKHIKNLKNSIIKITQFKNRRRTYIDIFPKNTH